MSDAEMAKAKKEAESISAKPELTNKNLESLQGALSPSPDEVKKVRKQARKKKKKEYAKIREEHRDSIPKLMRDRIERGREEPVEGSRGKVHTYESAVCEIKAKGFSHCGDVWIVPNYETKKLFWDPIEQEKQEHSEAEDDLGVGGHPDGRWKVPIFYAAGFLGIFTHPPQSYPSEDIDDDFFDQMVLLERPAHLSGEESPHARFGTLMSELGMPFPQQDRDPVHDLEVDCHARRSGPLKLDEMNRPLFSVRGLEVSVVGGEENTSIITEWIGEKDRYRELLRQRILELGLVEGNQSYLEHYPESFFDNEKGWKKIGFDRAMEEPEWTLDFLVDSPELLASSDPRKKWTTRGEIVGGGEEAFSSADCRLWLQEIAALAFDAGREAEREHLLARISHLISRGEANDRKGKTHNPADVEEKLMIFDACEEYIKENKTKAGSPKKPTEVKLRQFIETSGRPEWKVALERLDVVKPGKKSSRRVEGAIDSWCNKRDDF
jgi:hypothetical protein